MLALELDVPLQALCVEAFSEEAWLPACGGKLAHGRISHVGLSAAEEPELLRPHRPQRPRSARMRSLDWP